MSEALINLLKNYQTIDVFEEVVKNGGIGEHILALLKENGFKGNFKIHAIDNKFVPASSIESALAKNGLDTESLRSL